ncbi:MAG: DUF5674 family protein [Candidatus Omnitrophota bacterium]
MIKIIKNSATKEEITDMLKFLETYIKVAVDIKREILAGGGILHADCESILLDDGSSQEDIWGADWIPASGEIKFEALINIRPKQNNRSMKIQDPGIQKKVESIVQRLLQGR